MNRSQYMHEPGYGGLLDWAQHCEEMRKEVMGEITAAL